MLGKAGSQPTSEPTTSSTGASTSANGSGGGGSSDFLQAEGNRIALGVGIGLGVPGLIASVPGIMYMTRRDAI
jgi:hypothetical protein